MSDYPLEEIRSRYSALRDVCYLNTGTVGIMSEPVLERHLSRIARYERLGHAGEAEAREGYEHARAAIAQFINASPDEIALNRNATDGINFVLAGLTFPEGASFVTTDEEHPAVMFPIARAAQACNGNVRTVSFADSDDAILDSLRSLFETEAISLAVISHVSCESGRRLPIRKICRLCREYGVLSLVDGAQSVGHVPVDVCDIGCDFMTGNGHKWLCGPKGTGFLYVQRNSIGALTPPFVGAGATELDFDRNLLPPAISDFGWSFRPDAQRFEFGTRNWHQYGALADAIRELNDIGSDAITSHVSGLASFLKSELSARQEVKVQSPADWERSSGLVTFTVDGWQGQDLSQRLWNDHQIIQRRVQIPSGVRISCGHYTSEADLTRFLDALDALIAEVRTTGISAH